MPTRIIRGFAFGPIATLARLVLAASALALFVPLSFADTAWMANAAGLTALVIIIATNRQQSR